MKSRAKGWAVLGALLLSCDPRGVSVGSEESCVLPPELDPVTASDEALSPCAQIGENLLRNGGFETPPVSDCQSTLYCHFPAAVVSGWQTTSPDQEIEIWHDYHRGVDAAQGSQFVELNAKSRDTLFQDLELAEGSVMYWSLLHRGRTGLDSLDVRIGPRGATQSQRQLSSGPDGWHSYKGLYRVGADEPVTRFELASLSGVAEGNLVDAVYFALVQ